MFARDVRPGQLFQFAKPGDVSAFTGAVAQLTEKGGVRQSQIEHKLLVQKYVEPMQKTRKTDRAQK